MKRILFLLTLFISVYSYGQNTHVRPSAGSTVGNAPEHYRRVFNVLDYGAKADCKRLLDGAITNATNTFTSASANFTAADVGKGILLSGKTQPDLKTTISGFTNSTTITITAAATETFTADTFYYGTDNTVAFKATMVADSIAGGGVFYMPTGPVMSNGDNGGYFIGGALTTLWGGNPNSVLTIPLATATQPLFGQRKFYEIEGESKPEYASYGSRQGDSLAAHTGTWIFVATQGTGNFPALWGSAGISFSRNINYASWKNFSIFVPNNKGAGGPTIGGINANFINASSMENIVYGSDLSIANSPDPTNEVAAFIFGQTGQDVGCMASQLYANARVKYGFIISDHTYADYLTAQGLKFALVFPASAYAGHVTHFTGQWNTHYVYCPNTTLGGYITAGHSYVKIGLMNVENLTVTGSAGLNNLTMLLDSGNNFMSGNITIAFLEGHENDFKSYGGVNVMVNRLGQFANIKHITAAATTTDEQDWFIGNSTSGSLTMKTNHGNNAGITFMDRLAGIRQLSWVFDNAAAAIGGTPNTASGREFTIFDSTLNQYLFAVNPTASILGNPSSYGLRVDFPSSGSGSLHITAAGNAVLGGTVLAGHAFGTGFSALERTASNITFGDIGNVYLNSNTFYDGANYKYILTGPVAQFYAYNGDFTSQSAVSGTAGNTATLVTNWTFLNNGNLKGELGRELFITEGSGGMAGQTTLVSGTKAITITGLTTNSRAFTQIVAQGGTSGTVYQYKAVCTSNTLTITAITTAGATVTTDTSVLNYFVINSMNDWIALMLVLGLIRPLFRRKVMILKQAA